ncbi:MAG: amino acid-binding protein [Eubacteriales bacterium]|jgi:hypothetical protein
MVQQISVYAENKKGTMQKITGVLLSVNVNIIALVSNDSAEFGIVRMIVDQSKKAQKALEDAGYLVHCDDVLAVDMDDHPGGLNALLETIRESNTNIDYLYISYDRDHSVPIAIIHAPDIPELEACLTFHGFTVRQES